MILELLILKKLNEMHPKKVEPVTNQTMSEADIVVVAILVVITILILWLG